MPSRRKRNVEPRQSRTLKLLFYMGAIAVLSLSLIHCYCNTREQIWSKFVKDLFTNLFYFICAKELYFLGRQWLEGLTFKRSNSDNLLFMFIMPGVIAILSERDKYEPVHHMIIQTLVICFLVGAMVVVMFAFRMTRNKVDGFRTVERVPHAVGPGLAMVFSTFLENVINGKCGTPRYREAIEEYRRREDIIENYWFLYKVLILFPEAREHRESVEDCKTPGCNHRLCFEKMKYEYEVNGQSRVSWIEVLKVYDGDVRGYVAIAENRPLNTLYSMLQEGEIGKEMFKIQFHVYKNELRRILDQTPGCRGNYEFFHYRDFGRNHYRDFGRAVIKKINSLRTEEALRRHQELN